MDDAERLQRLEERYAHLQRHVVEQDKAMLELGDQVARLRQEVGLLRAARGDTEGGPPDAAAERPPHY
jgi:uncharacterized coiled-coil protein SlyX